MKTIVDVRNMACPAPVIETKRAIERTPGAYIEILSNADVARDNIVRYLKAVGVTPAIGERDGEFRIGFTAPLSPQPSTPPRSGVQTGPWKNLVVSKKQLGDGAAVLGSLLFRTFFHTLVEAAERPERIFFVNEGVFLTTADSPVADDLRAIEAAGTAIYSCGTCLDYYNLKDSLIVGSVGNMYMLVEMLGAGAPVL